MSRTLRSLAALAIFAIIALVSAGCSNTPAETSTGSSGGNTTASAPAETTPTAPTNTGSGNSGGNTTETTTAPAETTTASASATTHQQAVRFAQCMRDNGVRDFPDPEASGAFTIDAIANGSSLDTSSAVFGRAISACKDLEPAGFTGQTRSPEQQKAALEFAQCMRDNGVRDFPDPGPDDPMIDTLRIPSANQPGGMSILHAAMQKCSGHARDAGVTGP
jgi:hypothetical protein